jgi:hypothetical protein
MNIYHNARSRLFEGRQSVNGAWKKVVALLRLSNYESKYLSFEQLLLFFLSTISGPCCAK